MIKAEELINDFIVDFRPYMNTNFEPRLKSILQLYADEQSKEKYDKGWNDARKHYKANRFNF